MSEPSPEAKQAAEEWWKENGHKPIYNSAEVGFRYGYDTATAKLREPTSAAGIQARINVDGHDYMLVSSHYAILNEETAKLREELQIQSVAQEYWEKRAVTAEKELEQTRREHDTAMAKAQKDINDLNNLLRAAGWGQGEIDNAVTVVEECEAQTAKARGEQLNSLARDASKAWSHHNKGYSSATKPLWKIIKEACCIAYILGETDADYEAGRALTSLGAPTADVEELAKQLATDVTMLVLNNQFSTPKCHAVAALALAQARAPLVEEMKAMNDRWERMHRLCETKPEDDWDEAPFVAVQIFKHEYKRAALTGTGEKG